MKKIILSWIKDQAYHSFTSYEFEEKIVDWGREVFLVTHTASSYNRVFRDMKSKNEFEGYEVKEISTGKQWKKYSVIPTHF